MRAVLIALALLLVAAAPAAAAPRATQLATDHRANPLGIDEPAPRLSWTLQSDLRDDVQSSAQVQVAGSLEDLEHGRTLWDSGRRPGGEPWLDWDGPELRSATRYHWRVRVWGRDGDGSEWSRPAWFETGLLDADEWGGDWIGPGARDDAVDWGSASWIWHPPAGLPGGPTAGARHLRRSFTVPAGATIERGTLIATADNHYRLFVNGTDVGGSDDWQRAQRHDLTALLRPGENVIAARVVNDPDAGSAGGPAGFLASLRVVLAGGGSVVIRSNANWRSAETAPDGWTEPGFDASGWSRAQVVAPHGAGPWGPIAIPEAERPAPQLRRTLELSKPVRRARIYMSGVGYSELRVNGRRIGDDQLSPTFSRYDRRVHYVTRDVTDALRDGENVLGVTLGRGWYGVTTPAVWNFHVAPWAADPALRLRLVAEHPDGTHTTVVSDGSWRWSDSPTRFDSLYVGETYDARTEQAGWDEPGFDDAGWRPVNVVGGPAGTLRAEPLQPIRARTPLAPASVTRLDSGAYVFDFGRVLTGWTRLRASGAAGDELVLRYGEQLRADGTVANAQEHISADIQVDRYVLRGDGVETWEPRFSYKSFRYVEVRGLRSPPAADLLEAMAVHSDLAQTGRFTSSNELFDRIHEAMVQTTLNNLHGAPTDSPMFEKNGWLDAHLWAEDMLLNLDAAPLLSKWTSDIYDSVGAGGRLPVIAPDSGWGLGVDAIEWGSAGILVPWYLYERTGDERTLRRHYDGMRAYVEYKLATSPGLIADSALGDWISPGYLTPPEGARLSATAYLFRDLEVMRDAARLLGHDGDADRWAALADDTRAAFVREFYDPEAKLFRTERAAGFRQASQVLPLAYGLVPEGDRAAVTANLVRDIEEANDGHLNTGSLATRHLLPVLTREGAEDTAYEVATQTTYPSWGHWFAHGATTIWEGWDLTARSRNHAFLGTIDQWFFEDVAGVRATSPGYRTAAIEPHLVGGERYARASVATPYGDLAGGWRRTGDAVAVDASVPVGVTATVAVPAASAWAVREGGRPAFDADGVRGAELRGDRVVLTVGSGAYAFETDAVSGRVGAARDALAALERRIEEIGAGPGHQRLEDSARRARQTLERILRAGRPDVEALDDLRAAERALDALLAELDKAGDAEALEQATAAGRLLGRAIADVIGVGTRLQAPATQVAGSEFTADLTVTNHGDDAVRLGEAALAVPAGWHAAVDGDSPSRLAPGEVARVRFAVEAPVDADTGATALTARIGVRVKDADVTLDDRADVSLEPPVAVGELTGDAVLVDASGGRVQAQLRNRAERPVAVQATIHGDGWRASGVRPVVGLAAGEERTVELALERAGASVDRSPALELRAAYGAPGGELSRTVGAPLGDLALDRTPAARVSLEAAGFGVTQLTDGARRSRDGARGYTSDPPQSTRDATEWVRVDLAAERRLGAAVLWPRTQTPSDGELQVDGVCFPEDFTVEVSDDGSTWREVARVRGQGNPGQSPVVVDLGGATARHVRVLASRLGKPTDFEDQLRVYRLQLAELEVLAARPLPEEGAR